MKKLILLLSSGLGVGYLPSPGTIGSLWGVLLFFWLKNLPPFLYGFTLLTFILVSVFIADQAEELFEDKDSSKIVIDEVVGMMIALSFLPWDFKNLLLGFLFFRLFDIFKPFPLRRLENLSGGWGVVMDDVGAGIMANLALRLFAFAS
ncbi:MAG: phosphatidylglycerophosphatase A [Deltaproteobacteria bacterium]|nr:phosphatidylglycerophosphatase A [Deltaproteobacteria bacterium]